MAFEELNKRMAENNERMLAQVDELGKELVNAANQGLTKAEAGMWMGLFKLLSIQQQRQNAIQDALVALSEAISAQPALDAASLRDEFLQTIERKYEPDAVPDLCRLIAAMLGARASP